MSRFGVAHRFFANYLLVAQYLGAFPNGGITSPHHHKLNFKWRSLRTCYSLFMICFALFGGFFDVYYKIFSPSRTNLGDLTPLCSRIMSTILHILLFRLSMQWHRIIAKWSKVDALTFSCDPTASVNRKVNFLAVALFIFHGISFVLLHVYLFYNPITRDFITLNEYMRGTFIYIFMYFKFSSIFGMCLEALFAQWFFLTLFCEVFVIAVCAQLSSRWVVWQILLVSTSFVPFLKIKDERMWMSVREDYGRLSELCAVLNEALGNVILLVLANNTMILLFCCYYTVKAVQENNLWMEMYFSFALLFLLLRLICVCFSAAEVEIQNTKSINLLFCLPIELYNEEVARLNWLFSTTTNAIVPRGYFVVNRSLVLKLIGVGLSYELILLQYSHH